LSRFEFKLTIIMQRYNTMPVHIETCSLLLHKYFNPMEYIVYLIKTKNRTAISSASSTR